MAGETKLSDEKTTVTSHWTARKLHPIILVYVSGIFLVMMAVAYFVVHSVSAVKALALAAVGVVVSVLPELGRRIEYRVIGSVLERRVHRRDRTTDFERVVDLQDLSYAKPVRRGFKYCRRFNEANILRRFWMKHLSDRFSGEVHVETQNLGRVLAQLAEHGVQIRLKSRDGMSRER